MRAKVHVGTTPWYVKNMKKKLFILIIIIVVAIGAYLFWNFVTQDWRGNDNLEYINIKHNYSFQYSPNWNMIGNSQDDVVMLYNTENSPGDGGIPAGIKVDIMVLENYDNLDLESWIGQISQNGPGEEILTQENIIIAGLPSIRKTTSPFFENVNEGAPISIYFVKDDYIFMINYLGREPDYSVEMGNFELLLKSFDFN